MSAAPVIQLSWSLNGQNTTVQFDASISENHQASAYVSEHQVEQGPNITDHIRPLPMTLSIQAFVTNTPISGTILGPTSSTAGAVQGASLQNGPLLIFPSPQTLQFSAQFNRVSDVYEALLVAQSGGALIQVTTSLKTYQNFAITSISAPRDADHGNAVQFSIDLKQILTVSVTNVAAPAPIIRKKSVSQKPTRNQTTTEQATSQSFLSAITGIK